MEYLKSSQGKTYYKNNTSKQKILAHSTSGAIVYILYLLIHLILIPSYELSAIIFPILQILTG